MTPTFTPLWGQVPTAGTHADSGRTAWEPHGTAPKQPINNPKTLKKWQLLLEASMASPERKLATSCIATGAT